MLIEPNNKSNNMSVDKTDISQEPTKEISGLQALGIFIKSVFKGGASTNVLLILLAVGYVGYDQFINKAAPKPNPGPIPTPVVPIQKGLKDLVSPEAAPELAGLYHQIASELATDKARAGKEEGPVLTTVESFYNMQNKASQSFNNMTGIVGLTAIKTPISERLKVATGGNLNPGASLDDPTTNIRNRLVATLKQISEEFDERYKNVPLGTLPSF